MTARTTTLEVERDAIDQTRLVDDAIELAPGDVRLRIDRFAITANNITYAVFGQMLGYWDFFPVRTADVDENDAAHDDGDEVAYGRVPAMGWAEVVESRAPDIAIGRRFYGWYPMASHVVFTPTATRDGFRDDGPHRSAHAPVYRAYVAAEEDPMYDDASDGEDRHVLLRGLFLTGFLAEEFFADGGGSGDAYFGAERVVVLSASSKTAIGFAQRAAKRKGIEVVGVTSAANVDFVEKLGFYASVVTYDGIGEIATDAGAVSIDMAGNPAAIAAVHDRLGDRLAYSMTVGRSHHDAPRTDSARLIGPAPQLFFAPSEVGRRQEQWGREDYATRCAEALSAFVEGSRSWLTVEHRMGADAVEQAWRDVYNGDVAPDTGVVARIADENDSDDETDSDDAGHAAGARS